MAGFGARSTAMEVSYGIDLTGRLAVVTGASSGIGEETARVLAYRGAHVILACRDRKRAAQARERMLEQGEGRIAPERLELADLDLTRLASARSFAEGFIRSRRRLHLLIHNAGVAVGERRTTDDGFELHFGVNYLGPFLLTALLRDTIEASGPARILHVASRATRMASLTRELRDLQWEQRPYHARRAYADSKLLDVMHARELARRLQGSGVVAHAVHPGVVRTRLGKGIGLLPAIMEFLLSPWLKDPAQGAATSVYAATSQEAGEASGQYFADCRPQPLPYLADDPEVCAELWNTTEKLLLDAGQTLTLGLGTPGTQAVTN